MTSTEAKCRKSPSGPVGCEGNGSFLQRVPLIPLTTLSNGNPSPGPGWQLDDIQAAGPTRIFWLLQHDVGLDPVFWLALQPPEHGSIERVTVHVIAQSTGLPNGGMPRVSLVKMPLAADSNYESFEAVDASPDAAAYGLPHLIELTHAQLGASGLRLSNDFAYWLRITGETGPDAQNNRLKITGVTLTISP